MKTWTALFLFLWGPLGAGAQVVSYSTYLGGSGWDEATGIAVDPAGNAYVTGWTDSPDFPLMGGLPVSTGSREAFVAKLAPDGTLIYSTFLGGSGLDMGRSIAADASGHAYATGVTVSADFPRVHPLPPALDGIPGAFMAKLTPGGSSLAYSAVLRGSSGVGIAVDPQGSAYVTGQVGPLFPFSSALSPCQGGISDLFAAKLAPSGSNLAYLTCLGGTSEDWAGGIAVDPSGAAYLTGYTSSQDFPRVNALQPAYGGGVYDAFLTKLAPSGASIIYSTYLGGSAHDYSFGIAADPAGNASITGFTGSPEFPLLNPLQTKGDGFVTQLGPGGGLAFSSLFGGFQMSEGLAIAVDPQGNVYVGGETHADDFPLRDPVQARCAPVNEDRFCRADGFILKIDPKSPRLLFSTYFGGTDSPTTGFLAYDVVQGIAVTPRGDIYIAGRTASSDFPVVHPVQATFAGGSFDAFAARIAMNPNRPPVCTAASASPSTLWPPNGRLVPVSIRGVTDPDGDPVVVTVTAVRQDEPLGRTPNASGIGTPSVSLRAERDGKGDGRVYHLRFEATDGNGGLCSGEVRVCVPHDQGAGKVCGDGGGVFGSLTPGS